MTVVCEITVKTYNTIVFNFYLSSFLLKKKVTSLSYLLKKTHVSKQTNLKNNGFQQLASLVSVLLNISHVKIKLNAIWRQCDTAV
jgi:hypothetical protein